MREAIKEASTNADKKRLAEAGIDRLHSRLEWIVDTLIPSDQTLSMPSANEIGVVDKYLARVLVLRDDLADQFLAEIEKLPDDMPTDALAELTALGAGFDLVSRLIAGAYFLDEAVARKLRYKGQEEIVREQDYDPMIVAIEAVIKRGRHYIEDPID
jgi:hypothetical protein